MKLALIILSVLSIAIADVFVKFAAKSGDLMTVFKSPWFIAAIVLYIFELVVYTYLFVHKVELSYVGIVQTVIYAVVVLGSGFLFFHETFSMIQYVGIVLALVGVVLVNLPA